MPRGLPISTFVDISTAIAAGGVLRTEFGTGLLITTDDAIAAGGSGKAQVFSDIDAVNAVFDAVKPWMEQRSGFQPTLHRSRSIHRAVGHNRCGHHAQGR